MEKVFKWLTQDGGDPKAVTYVNWFARNFSPNDFTGIDRLMVCFIQYCASLSISPTKKFFMSYLKVDGKRDMKKYNIRTDTMSSFDYNETSQLEAGFQTLAGIAGDTYDRYMEQDLTDRSFKVDVDMFLSEMQTEAIQSTFYKYFSQLSDGFDPRDVSLGARSALAKVDTVFDRGKIKTVEYVSAADDDLDMRFICKTGLPCIDGDVGGIYTDMIYTFTGQPGSGKTRFAWVHFVYQIITVAKEDVLVYNLELSDSQAKNIIIAYHILRLYGGRIKIPDSVMNKKEMTEEQQRIYEAAKIDLFESGNYGKIIIRGQLVVEEYEQEVTDIKRDNPNLSFVTIDYLGFSKSKPTTKWDARKQKYEIITDAYDISVDLKKALHIGFLCLNQYTDEGITAALAGKKIRSGHVQGGQVVERHSDYDMTMTMTEEQELANVRSLSIAKKRGSKGFNNVTISVDLSVSIFRQEVD